MKALAPLLFLLAAIGHSQTTELDLTNLPNYANQERPAYITKDNTPVDNPITDIGATLGRVLFYDQRLSTTGTISCSSCHQQSAGFGDLADASVGVDGTTGRHSMRLINSRFANEEHFFWDERADTLELQTTQPIQDHIEMGFSGGIANPDLNELIRRLSELEQYSVLFTAVYGDPSITEERLQSSLAQFVRSIESFDSAYDDGLAQTNNLNAPFPNFTAAENVGKALFMGAANRGGAGCASCHQPPEFDIGTRSGNNGVITTIGGGTDTTITRAPSLRDVVDADGNTHGGFMHDASLTTLMDVVEHYNAIPAVVPNLDPRLRPGGQPQRLNLTQDEKENLVAFLETLTGQNVYTDEKWSSPFSDTGELSLIVLPTTSSITTDGSTVTLTCQGVPNVTYLLRSARELGEWDEGIAVTADADGLLQHTLAQTRGVRFFVYTYTEGLQK